MNLRGVFTAFGIIVVLALIGLLVLNQDNILYTLQPTPITDTVDISDESRIITDSEMSDSHMINEHDPQVHQPVQYPR